MTSRPISKLVYSTTPPQNTNVAWIDVNNRVEPSIKIYSAGGWRTIISKQSSEPLTEEEIINLLNL